jgi:hypothetical protein
MQGMLKIRRNMTVILAVTAVLLIAGIILLSIAPKELAPLPEMPDMGALLRAQDDEIVSINFFPRGGEPFTLFRDGESGDLELDSREELLFPAQPNLLSFLYRTAVRMDNLLRVEEHASDGQLAGFGLDDPEMVWRVNFADMTSIELAVGDLSAINRGRYVRRTDNNEIFLLQAVETFAFSMKLEDLYSKSFLPLSQAEGGTFSWVSINHVLIERNEGTIEFIRRSEEEMENAAAGDSKYQLLRPVVAEASERAVEDLILTRLSMVSPDIIAEVNPQDLSVYGLDNPERVTVSEDGGWSGTLLIGKYDQALYEGVGGRYVMIEGTNAVLSHLQSDYPFLRVKYAELRSSMPWPRRVISDVSTVTYNLGRNTRTLSFERGESVYGRLDGKILSESNADRLFYATLSLTHHLESDAEIPSAAPDYRITINFIGGGSDTMELYSLNETQLLMVFNGENQQVYLTRTDFKELLLDRFDMLDRGEDLPFSG